MTTTRYYKPNLPLKLKGEIIRLFEENPSIGNQYDNNLSEFVRESVRSHIQKLKKSTILKDEIQKALIDDIFDIILKSKG